MNAAARLQSGTLASTLPISSTNSADVGPLWRTKPPGSLHRTS